MLGDKNRVVSHGRLSAVIGGLRRGQAIGYKPLGVLANNRMSMPGQILCIRRIQTKALPKRRMGELFEQRLQVAHESTADRGRVLFDGL